MSVHGWTGLVWFRGTAIWEARFQLKWAVGVRGEGQPEGVDLCLDLRHGPGRRAFFQDAHVAGEVFPGVGIKFGVWGGYCDLLRSDSSFYQHNSSFESSQLTK